ncbi:MAG: hypothetical protein ACLFV8_11740, partial [Alphaproteobacteria bacterium]
AFVLGALSEPEQLKRAGLGSYEDIGRAMARECQDGTQSVWAHELLRHNEDERARLCDAVGNFLFQP